MSKEKEEEVFVAISDGDGEANMIDVPLHENEDSAEEEEEEEERMVEYNIRDANNDARPEAGPSFEDEIRMQEIAQTNTAAWRDSYFKLMDQSIKRFHMLVRMQKWVTIDPPAKCPHPHIALYEREHSPSQGYYTLKAEAILQCRAERIHYVIRDHNLETRMRWDDKHLVDIGQYESYMGRKENIDVVHSEVKLGIPGIANRYLLGIHWHGYNDDNDSYTYVFKSTCHSRYRCPNDKVNVLGLIGTVVRTFDNPLQCHLVIAIHLNPGDQFPTLLASQLKEWLRDRVARYEYVVKNWNTFYKKTDDPTKIENRK